MRLLPAVLAVLLADRPLPASQESAPAAQAAQSETPRARLDQAAALLERNAAAEALRLLQPLVAEGEAIRDPALLMEAHYQLGLGYVQKNEYAPALDHHRRALELSRRLPSPRVEARALSGMGVVFKNQGDHAQALSHCQEAIAIFESLGDREGEGRAWVTVGAVRDQMGEYRAALESYQRAKERLEGSKGQPYFRLLTEIGITYKNLGSFEEALAHYAEALAEQRRTGDKYGQAMTLSNMGVAYGALGQQERAIEHYELSLALCHELGERRGQIFLLANLANAWQSLGDGERPIAYIERQVQLAREIGIRLSEGLALKNLGDLLLVQGRVPEARERYEQALAIQRATGARARICTILAGLAEVALREGRPAEALRLGEEALGLAREAESPELEWQVRLALARAARRSDDLSGALAHLRAGVEIINGVRGRVLTDVGKIGYLDARQAVFHELVQALHLAGRAGEALEAAEAARSRAFSDLLAGRQVSLKAADAGSLQAIRDTEARLRAESRVVAERGPASAELLHKRAATEADLERRLDVLKDEQRELASMVVAEPLSLEEIVATARRLQATIVEYLVTDERLFIWLVSPAGEVESAVAEVERERLRQSVRALHQELNDVDLAALRDPRSVRERLAELYRWTLAPVARHLPQGPGTLLVLIPHDALLLVPFAALIDERGRFLADKHTLSSAASVGVLRYTAEKKRRVTSPQRPYLLALAEPEIPEEAGLSALPYARREVLALGRGFPARRRTVLLAQEASEANVKRLGPGQTYLHFAVHGLVRDDRPWDSALVLAPGGGEDGWLKAGEAFGLDLRADLVVLSGCSTGLGKLTGDGILGLARAFIYAGTPSVLVSQWDVSDRATAFLMERFYAGLRAGQGKARALRAAQLAAKARFPHPALWAAFTLVGEPL